MNLICFQIDDFLNNTKINIELEKVISPMKKGLFMILFKFLNIFLLNLKINTS
jgi:hypothetical protein